MSTFRIWSFFLITETNETSGTPPSEPVNPTEGSTGGDDMAVTCRPACSVEFCSEKETKKRRICSAAGYDHVCLGDSRSGCGKIKCVHVVPKEVKMLNLKWLEVHSGVQICAVWNT